MERRVLFLDGFKIQCFAGILEYHVIILYFRMKTIKKEEKKEEETYAY